MPKASDWTNFVYINLAFIAQVIAIYYLTALSDLKKNWAKYRCNPMYMPFSDNVKEDFVYCVQNVQTSYMGYLLQPISYITSNLTQLGGEFTESLNAIRTIISNIRTFATSIIENIFGVFLNLIIEFEKIIIGIKDVIGKVVGIMVTLMYVLDGSIKTMKSSWNGPPGQMVRKLGGSCFHPDTPILLKNGRIKTMEYIGLGDILTDGSRVLVNMKIENTHLKDDYFAFEESGVNNSDIHVTGTHFVYDTVKNEFIQVCQHKDAISKKGVTSSWFSCLITDTHRIPIGKYTFWDWEDDEFYK